MAEAYGAALSPRSPMDADAVRAAYARQAGSYDNWFGVVSRHARREAVNSVNRTAGEQVLEVGVGTGLALPFYGAEKRVTGIDLSGDMLKRARQRVGGAGLRNVEALLEMDAQATSFRERAVRYRGGDVRGLGGAGPARSGGGIAPDRPPGRTDHFRQPFCPGSRRCRVDRARAGAGLCQARLASGFPLPPYFHPADLAGAKITPMRPFGLFRLVELGN